MSEQRKSGPQPNAATMPPEGAAEFVAEGRAAERLEGDDAGD
ncbi:MAG: hypothetical protein OXI76_17020 [Gemmatimonadota bacterium]|nr:hypothetical protein [Gemmatimonadota bacterium]